MAWSTLGDICTLQFNVSDEAVLKFFASFLSLELEMPYLEPNHK
jgi:hypothetical protein